jgi:uncharacterized protein CbrC (UPF0167 family)
VTAPEITFRYFRAPHHFSSYDPAGKRCPLCGLVRLGYEGGFHDPVEHDDLGYICEVCLAAGRLGAKGLTLNDGYRDLSPALKERHPELSQAQIEALSQSRRSELEQRTPAIMTWQDLWWPAHCGDYCCYVKEAGQQDFNRLASDGDGLSFFRTHLKDADRYDVEDVWDSMRPDAPQDNSVGYSVGVYLFQCLECGEYVIEWDCD